MRPRRILPTILLLLLLLTPTAYAKYSKPYYIKVDLSSQIVTVYHTATDTIARQMICSTGVQETTPRGTYYLPKPEAGEREPWYYFSLYDCYTQYVTRIIDNVMFHSIPCSYKSQKSVSETAMSKLGTPASHGCIRLLWPDAKFIAEECEPGTRVEIYKSRKEYEELKVLLLAESYDGSRPYREYCALTDTPGALGMGSGGDAVRDLQSRLRDLGIFNGEVTGVYRADTVNAVRYAQRLIGLDANGIADEAFRGVIFSESAPVAFNVVLRDGSNGPAVRKLQQRLSELRVYEGPLDSIYDREVADSLKRFQAAYGFDISDEATLEVQQAVAYEVERLHDIFDPLGGYTFALTEEPVRFGRVEAASGIRIREKPTKHDIVLARIPDRALVLLLEKNGDWSLIQHGAATGYVKNEFMRFYKAKNCVLTYTSLDGYASYAIGHTKQDYLDGAISKAEQSGNEEPSAVVNTGREDLMLNLREAPTPDGAVLRMLPNGTQVRALLDVGDWSLVDYSGQRGYLMKQYLTGAAESGGTVGQNGERLQAVIKPRHGEKAQIYDADSDDGEIIGHVKAGLYVAVLENTESGWSHVTYQGHEGFMRDEDLVFLNGVV